MIEVRQTQVFAEWLASLKDLRAMARIAERARRLGLGLTGDARPVGEGVSELRIDYGPGYRVYFKSLERDVIVILLCGGDKSTQDRDIKTAKRLAETL